MVWVLVVGWCRRERLGSVLWELGRSSAPHCAPCLPELVAQGFQARRWRQLLVGVEAQTEPWERLGRGGRVAGREDSLNWLWWEGGGGSLWLWGWVWNAGGTVAFLLSDTIPAA